MNPYHRPGDRVSRETFLDDGTWAREGDACLPGSPLRRGTVVAVRRETGRGQPHFVYDVRWDGEDRVRRGYFWYGVDRVEECEEVAS